MYRAVEATDSFTFAQLLAIAALIAATCEYGEMVRRRKTRRRMDHERLATEAVVRQRLDRLRRSDQSK
jgi:hypothetical protein